MPARRARIQVRPNLAAKANKNTSEKSDEATTSSVSPGNTTVAVGSPQPNPRKRKASGASPTKSLSEPQLSLTEESGPPVRSRRHSGRNLSESLNNEKEEVKKPTISELSGRTRRTSERKASESISNEKKEIPKDKKVETAAKSDDIKSKAGGAAARRSRIKPAVCIGKRGGNKSTAVSEETTSTSNVTNVVLADDTKSPKPAAPKSPRAAQASPREEKVKPKGEVSNNEVETESHKLSETKEPATEETPKEKDELDMCPSSPNKKLTPQRRRFAKAKPNLADLKTRHRYFHLNICYYLYYLFIHSVIALASQ